MFKKIIKRDGKIVDFKLEKIVDAITKAGVATGEFDRAHCSCVCRLSRPT